MSNLSPSPVSKHTNTESLTALNSTEHTDRLNCRQCMCAPSQTVMYDRKSPLNHRSRLPASLTALPSFYLSEAIAWVTHSQAGIQCDRQGERERERRRVQSMPPLVINCPSKRGEEVIEVWHRGNIKIVFHCHRCITAEALQFS